MIPLIILSVLLIAVGISFFSSVVTGLVPSTNVSSKTKNTKIKKLISNYLPSGGQLEPNQSIQSQDGSYILKNEGDRLVLIGPDGEVVKEWTSENENSVLSVSYNGTVSYGDTIIHQGTDNSTEEYKLEITNDGNLELSNNNGDSENIGLKWTQLGDDIFSGESVSLSSDGKIVAIGARFNDGHVRVYEYNNGSWTQLGGDMDGEAEGEQSGYSVSLSSDGKIVAIGVSGSESLKGHVRVYEYTENKGWTKLGGDMDGEEENYWSGYRVSLSSDGKIVAIGVSYKNDNDNYSGCVRVYQYTENKGWTQLGDDINCEEEDDLGVSLSSDGKIVAIGYPVNNYVRVYEYTEDEGWTQLGGDIFSVYSVSLSSDGKIVTNGYGVYEYKEDDNSNKEWILQLGDDINGAAGFDQSGYSVSLSSDGKIVTNGYRVYEYKEDDNGNKVWTQLGGDIFSGYSVSLSSDGKIVAISVIPDASVRVYKLI